MFKKLCTFLLMGVIGIMLFPSMVDATIEVKKVGNIVYTIETKEFSDIDCPGMSDELDFYRNLNNEILIFDDINSKYYMMDRNLVCTEIEGTVYDDYIDNDTKTAYEWRNDNKIYELVIPVKANFVMVKSNDVTVDTTKEYYIYDAQTAGYNFVPNPVNGELANYFERTVLIQTSDTVLDPNKKYYYIFSGMEIPLEDLNVDNISSYSEILPSSEYTKTYKLTADIDDFVIDKEDVNESEDITFKRLELDALLTIKNKTYLLLTSVPYSYLFETDGTYVPFNPTANRIYGSGSLYFGQNGLGVYVGEIPSVATGSGISIIDDNFNEVKNVDTNSPYFTSEISSYGNVDWFYGASLLDSMDYTFYFISKYDLVSGNNQTYSNSDLTIIFSGDLSKLSKVKVNDEELAESNFLKAEGSTKITLKKDYLKKLSKGTYSLKVEYNDGGYAEASFVIPEANPETSDGIINSILLGCISIVSILGCTVYLNKKKRYN